ncbi:lambda family phage tail tape measure protein [Serratia fonticola]|uniref:Lambda family phage tail tape measure protein n=1 Tax=Serratia fonticola TaxID=47917 RepID=A0A542CZ97_SERFO|nr:lambda family phage tail tape measure protein [Serratia fonticola]TQI96155.1 lambda family phage tail tape measure protein [Serratia fonticola]TVZ70652.1 lambda family phage tail tape measure protein [Serratia fonticola]
MADSAVMVLRDNSKQLQELNKKLPITTSNFVKATTLMNEFNKSFSLGIRDVNNHTGATSMLLVTQLREVQKALSGDRIKYENIRKELRRLPTEETKKKEPGLLSGFISDKQAEAARKSWQTYIDSATDIAAAVNQVAIASHQGLTEILSRLLTTGRFSFRTFSTSILQMSAGLFSKIISGFAVDKAVKWIDSTFFPAADGNKTAAADNPGKVITGGATSADAGKCDGKGDTTKEKLDEDKKTWGEYYESVTDVYKGINEIGQATHKGLSDNLTELVTTGKANFKDFTSSILKMIIQVINQLLVAYAIQSAMGWISKTFSPASDAGTANNAFALGAYDHFTFDSGGYTGDGGKYEQAGIVHRGEFVMTKEATQRIGVDNLYTMMRGYANGGLVGGNKAPMFGLAGEQGGGITVNSTVVMNNDGAPRLANESSAGGGMGKLVQGIVNQAITERLGKELKPGGLIWNASAAR